jgi:hypothetical protein
MNNTVKSAIPVAVISAVLVALFFVGYSFWFKEQVFKPFAERQQSDIESLRSDYQTQMQKVADNIMARVDQTNKTLDAAIASRNTDLFLSDGESQTLESAKVNALADAIMARLNSVIPTAEDQDRGYTAVSERVADRLNPILSEIARTGNLTRSDVEFYSSQISGMIDGLLREEMAEKQRLNTNLLATQAIAQDSLRLSQEMSALYLASLKDEGVLSRILSLPVRVVQDVSTLSIVGSADRKKVEERLFNDLNRLEQRLAEVQANMPRAGEAPKTATSTETAVTEPVPATRARPTPPEAAQ